MKEHILQFFKYEHLPARLQVVSAPFCELARALVDEEHGLPRNPERTVALRKLLEAKDAAVRAEVAEDEEEAPAKPYDGSAKPSRAPDVGGKENIGFWKLNRQAEPVRNASDEEVAAIGEACERYGLDPSYLHPALAARLRALGKSRT